VSDSQDLSRRSFMLGASATIAMRAVATASVSAADRGATPLADLGAVEAVARMARGELSAERYASALLERCAAGGTRCICHD
jgi:hypothetical protein